MEIGNIAFRGVELSYTNEILDESIKMLKEAIEKEKLIEKEIDCLYEKCREMKKTYPNCDE